ncbi:arylsulfatase [Pseudomonas laurylsulfatiphila]|uniref:Arylsulfatase n=1 Tax=Pseudomonas laurylsulfatiphila TaxID=2011015 RepID=A0A2S6FJA0_9PSED|nr:arylsulfatase [Pseudomonas laurylsulfatiphila]PPK37528.1 arylsulfatase [Pseudomonas laurylsulfatiphila]
MNRLSHLFVVSLCATLSTTSLAAVAQKRPNIIVLVADDWGYSDVGSFGSEIATPNIDSLAKEGVRFADFHAAASCSPTRSMLLTGVDNHRNGVGNMPETMPAEHLGKPGYDGVLNDRVITVASLLKDSGYHTYITGKWHLGKTAGTLPNNRGFERSFIQADSGSDNWQERPYAPLYDKAAWFENGQPAHLPQDYYSSTFIVDRAIDYIAADSHDQQPFFAYLGFQANHVPIQAPREVVDKYQGIYKDGWDALRKARHARAIELGLIPEGSGMVTMASTGDWNALRDEQKRYEARRMEVYAGMAETMDREVGRLIAHLKATGEYDNTLFVFLSDNGSEPTDPYDITAIKLWLQFNYSRDIDRLGGKGAFSSIGPSWASAAAAPLSGYKFFAGEGGLRTPLIISGVPGIQANQITRAFTHVTDIVPTLLEAAGVKAHEGLYRGKAVEPLIGSSLVPVLQGKSELVHSPQKAIGYELSGSAALFKGDYKLVKNIEPVGDGQWHLYNLKTDPGEVFDLQQQMPERFVSMQVDYAEYARANNVLPMPVGYDYKRQGQLYALKHVLIPKLKAAWPPALAGLLLLAGALVVWRRRRSERAS